MAQTDYLSCE